MWLGARHLGAKFFAVGQIGVLWYPEALGDTPVTPLFTGGSCCSVHEICLELTRWRSLETSKVIVTRIWFEHVISEIKPKDFFPHVWLSMLRTGKAWLYVPSRYRTAAALPPSLSSGKELKTPLLCMPMKIFSSLSSEWSFYVRYLERGRQMGWTLVRINCSQWNTTLYMSTSQWISACSPRSHKGEHHTSYRRWQQILFVAAVTADDSRHSAWKSASVAQKKVFLHSI